MSNFFDEMDELDQLSSKIKSIQTSTAFTSELGGNKKDESNEREKISPFELLEDFKIIT